MYLSIRTYRIRSGRVDEVLHRVDRDLAEAFAQEDGFAAYQVARTGAQTVAAVTVFRDEEQGRASNELAAAWVADELAEFEVERLGVIGGEVMVGRVNADLLEPTHH